MSITLIPSKDRNMYFGKRKLELGRIYEYAEELRKQEPTGRVHNIGGRRVFSRLYPCKKCGWIIDYTESLIKTQCGSCIRYYHEFCHEVST